MNRLLIASAAVLLSIGGAVALADVYTYSPERESQDEIYILKPASPQVARDIRRIHTKQIKNEYGVRDGDPMDYAAMEVIRDEDTPREKRAR